jgi:hypothetical protein
VSDAQDNWGMLPLDFQTVLKEVTAERDSLSQRVLDAESKAAARALDLDAAQDDLVRIIMALPHGCGMRAAGAVEGVKMLRAERDALRERVAKLRDALECARAIFDTPISRRRLGLDPHDERLAIFRAALQEDTPNDL